MIRSILWFVAIALLLMGQGVTLATPLDEIRQILRRDALVPPAESSLTALSKEHLASGLRKIDPYARFFKESEYCSPGSGHASWTGIGANLAFRGGEFFLTVYKGGAADQAGLPDRSKLLAINGQSIARLSVGTVMDRLKGEDGTNVTLSIEYPDGHRSRVPVERRAFKPLDVEVVQSGTLQILRVREFVGGVTRPALLATIDFISKKGKVKTDGTEEMLVIDLRDAGGGDLYEALDMAGLFLSTGRMLGTLSSHDGERTVFRASEGRKFKMPVVLLVGHDTASAAEVFAGALQQHGRAKLVGQRTYGKCSSQTDTRLSDGSVLRYTNREVLLPNGLSCSNVGLLPDLNVPDQVFGELSSLMSAVEAEYLKQRPMQTDGGLE